MCGIAGIFSSGRGSAAADRGELALILGGLARRGPDGEGTWASPDGRLLLGHRRLAIIDPGPSGAQPMTDRERRFTLVFNGEIYNYRELRAALVEDGAEFASTSDTEVILELWRRRGVAALAELSGMYALGIWDAERRELVLARDPYGIKPLYYSETAGVVRFASQVRALEAGRGLSLEVDPAAVAGFLSWGAVPEPLTLRRAIRALPAGHWCRFAAGESPRCQVVPRIAVGVEGERTSAVHRGDAAAIALQASVARHLVADVPIGLFLSAGLDSALIAALAVRAARSTGSGTSSGSNVSTAALPTAMTLTWKEVAGTPADEAPLARETARILGLPHIVKEIHAEEIRQELPGILSAMDQPSIDGFNTWLIARVARENGLKVALSGLGGDEIFGGYSSFRDVPRWHRRRRSLAWLPGLAAVWPHAARKLAPHQPKLAGVLRHAGSLAGTYVLRRALYLPDEVDGLLAAAGLADSTPGRRPYYAPLDAWERLGESTLGEPSHLLDDPWRAVHRLESSIYLRHQLLRDADWAGMAHGVEIRTPLVDARLRTLLERANFEPARSQGKAALVRSIAPELPAELFTRPKTGFQLPIADWLEPDRSGRPRLVGQQSRRLARIVLASFGVSLPGAA